MTKRAALLARGGEVGRQHVAAAWKALGGRMSEQAKKEITIAGGAGKIGPAHLSAAGKELGG